MNKIQEILNKYRDITRYSEYPESEHIQAMKEYAEWYAKKCLEIAANEVKLTTGNISEKVKDEWVEFKTITINPYSITGIKLPTHE